MTEKEFSQNLGIDIEIFEDGLFPDEAFYIPALKTMFLSDAISDEKRVQVALHEIGHRNHAPDTYRLFRERCELEANRNMIHYLMKAELDECEAKEYFNYLDFMKKYKLKTIADETMVKEEFQNLIDAI
ncbi:MULTISPECIES: ImmA/IrrE family metallo-endopeptidase [Streptococcus]|uniref:ImmA/IrrE family metallo-endopeptidase n=2 Tax=Streptococcus TaxID=1301 RepID=A0A6G4MZD7_STRAP|nr:MULTISPECIES: ImmA/IrrE family metallo-endopeptidase [Streptococcus]MBO0365200.1 ImmA/IrrE family metallo-endopeptidase [Streptococcus vaginalis]MCW1014545.1 ImmA/IrrE family metallo-endopeptidase [Streptococcus anginosus]MCW1042411.1 ImmA/IrrE family metallo-endopeptidase [Streptococcus anginosus]MDU7641118.1 ImmA/IrrE family metallo-endopeptidase [Streptococcus anginosus]MED5823375.1 ImmA/IrrE family metallo-endopeptidase [Streptococcus anginosus]